MSGLQDGICLSAIKGGKQVSGGPLQGSCDSDSIWQIRLQVLELGDLLMTLDQKFWRQHGDNARGVFPVAVRILPGKKWHHEGDKGQSKDVKWQTRSTIYGYKVVLCFESYLLKKGLANRRLSIAF